MIVKSFCKTCMGDMWMWCGISKRYFVCPCVTKPADRAWVAANVAKPVREGDCAFWRSLDRKFGTDPRSPLHHDNRCKEAH